MSDLEFGPEDFRDLLKESFENLCQTDIPRTLAAMANKRLTEKLKDLPRIWICCHSKDSPELITAHLVQPTDATHRGTLVRTEAIGGQACD